MGLGLYPRYIHWKIIEETMKEKEGKIKISYQFNEENKEGIIRVEFNNELKKIKRNFDSKSDLERFINDFSTELENSLIENGIEFNKKEEENKIIYSLTYPTYSKHL